MSRAGMAHGNRPSQDDPTRYPELESHFSDPGSSVKNAKTQVIPFSKVTDDTKDTGVLFTGEGLFVGLNPDSSPDAVMRIGLDDDSSCPFRLRRGSILRSPSGRPFQKLYLMRPSKVPNDASKSYVLDVFWSPDQCAYALDSITIGAAPGSLNVASAQVAVAGAAVSLVAARAQRRTVWVHNGSLAGVNIFIGAAGVTILNGLKILPGTTLPIDTVAALFGIGDAAGPTTVSLLEQFD